MKQLFQIIKAYEVNKTKQVINRVDKKVNKERKPQIFYQFHPIWFLTIVNMLGKVRKTFDCSLCQITCYSPATFSDHLNGKAHKKKLETSDVPNGNFHCQICNIGATDQGGFDLHLAGKKHYKKAVQELAQQRLRSLKVS